MGFPGENGEYVEGISGCCPYSRAGRVEDSGRTHSEQYHTMSVVRVFRLLVAVFRRSVLVFSHF